ncbi:hypothetical protein [Streptacidiphilus rugosus]|nr:hypothetical protein [Streptacidiphilus rugosus]
MSLRGAPLAPAAQTRPITDLDRLPRGDLCVRCSVRYPPDPQSPPGP